MHSGTESNINLPTGITDTVPQYVGLKQGYLSPLSLILMTLKRVKGILTGKNKYQGESLQ